MLMPDCVLPGCGNSVVGFDACVECREAWGPHLCRAGKRPAFVPSGWVLVDGGWRIPWGVGADPSVKREARLALASRHQLERDLALIGSAARP